MQTLKSPEQRSNRLTLGAYDLEMVRLDFFSCTRFFLTTYSCFKTGREIFKEQFY